jgi:hypothetical protein
MMLLAISNLDRVEVSAQESTPEAGAGFAPDEATALVIRESSLIAVNTSTLEETTLLTLPTRQIGSEGARSLTQDSPAYVGMGTVDRGFQWLYTIEYRGSDRRTLPTASQLVRTRVATGERTVLIDGPGLSDFVPSPDGRHLLVAYYEAEFYDSRSYACVLDVESGVCDEVDIVVQDFDPGTWVDDNTIVIESARDLLLYSVTIDELEAQLLPLPEEWFPYTAVAVPGTQLLLISARLRVGSAVRSDILQYDLETNELSDFRYDVLSDEYTSVDQWDFSPNNEYLLYGSRRKALVEFETGDFVAELVGVIQAVWLSNNTLLATVGVGERTGESMTIVLDPVTGEIRQIAEERIGLLVDFIP